MAGPLSDSSNASVSISTATRRKKFGIVTADWNAEVTGALEEGCHSLLKSYEVSDSQITTRQVPGSFEIPLGAQYMAESGMVHAVICIGCIVKGETPHFHYIADTVTHKIGDLNLHYNLPFIFGILTVENEAQAKARAGGELGNKGEEAGLAALRMLELRHSLQKGKAQPGFR